MTSQNSSRQFQVLKDNGERWTITYSGDGVRWSPSGRASDSPTPHTTSSPAKDALADAIAQALTEITIDLIRVATPHLIRWISEKGLPGVKRGLVGLRDKVRRGRGTGVRPATVDWGEIQVVEVTPREQTAPSNSVIASTASAEVVLTRAEAQQQLEDIELLSRIVAEKLRLIDSATIVEERAARLEGFTVRELPRPTGGEDGSELRGWRLTSDEITITIENTSNGSAPPSISPQG